MKFHLIVLKEDKLSASSYTSESEARQAWERKKVDAEDGWMVKAPEDLAEIGIDRLLVLYNDIKPGKTVTAFKSLEDGCQRLFDYLSRGPDYQSGEDDQQTGEDEVTEKKGAAAPKKAAKKEAAPKKAAAKKEPAPKKAAPAKKEGAAPKTNGAGRHGKFADDAKIKIIAKDNPFREGSKAAERFSALKSGMTVKEAKKVGATSVDLQANVNRGYLEIG